MTRFRVFVCVCVCDSRGCTMYRGCNRQRAVGGGWDCVILSESCDRFEYS